MQVCIMLWKFVFFPLICAIIFSYNRFCIQLFLTSVWVTSPLSSLSHSLLLPLPIPLLPSLYNHCHPHPFSSPSSLLFFPTSPRHPRPSTTIKHYLACRAEFRGCVCHKRDRVCTVYHGKYTAGVCMVLHYSAGCVLQPCRTLENTFFSAHKCVTTDVIVGSGVTCTVLCNLCEYSFVVGWQAARYPGLCAGSIVAVCCEWQ